MFSEIGVLFELLMHKSIWMYFWMYALNILDQKIALSAKLHQCILETSEASKMEIYFKKG